MYYKLAADLVVIIHFAFIIFAILGGLLVLYRRWIAWFHVPAGMWAAAISFGGWICPLTPIELSLRQSAGQHGYEGGFVEHYIIPVIYPEAYTPQLAILLGVGVIIINVIIYGFVFYKWRKRD